MKDIRDSLKEYGINVGDYTTGEIRVLCPECSSSRQHKPFEKCLAVNLDTGVWFCHHCGFRGGICMNTYNDRLVEPTKVYKKPEYADCEIEDKRVLDWFAKRCITPQTLRAFHITAKPTWMYSNDGQEKGGNILAMCFPFYYNGEVVNIKYRTSDKRFRQEKDAMKVFFNYDMANKSEAECLYIVEGEMDVLALYECGITSVVSVPDGAPSPNTKSYTSKFDFLKDTEEFFDKFKRIVFAGDNDAAGKKLEEELVRRIGIERCCHISWLEGCKDANDMLMKYGKETLVSIAHQYIEYPLDGVRTISDAWDDVFTLHEQPEVGGYEIGWDNAVGYFNVEVGQMTIVTGIPSHGKSTFIDAVRVNLWKNYGVKSVVFSPENFPIQRHIASLAEMYIGKNFYKASKQEITNALIEMSEGFFFIQPEKDTDMMDVDTILSRTKSLVFREGIQVLVIDPWNEVEHKIPVNQREDQYISAQLAKIRRFARMQKIHIFVIAHPRQLMKNVNGGYPRPTAYDIAGGAMWRNKADNILCVHRPDINTPYTDVDIQKIRFRRNGKAGTLLKFQFDVRTSQYSERYV